MRQQTQHYEYFRKNTISQPEPTGAQLKRWRSQSEKVFEAFYESPRTMFQVSKITNIERPNVCRRVDDFRKAGTIRVVSISIDPLTQRRAQYFSTNPGYWPKHSNGEQIKLHFSEST